MLGAQVAELLEECERRVLRKEVNSAPRRVEQDRVKRLAGVSNITFENGWLRPSIAHQFG